MCKLRVMSQERLKIEVKLLLGANRKSYMLTGTTTDDPERPRMAVSRFVNTVCLGGARL